MRLRREVPETVELRSTDLELALTQVLTPGTYELDEGLVLRRRGQVLLGLGYATIVAPADGLPAVTVAAPGCRVAGVVVDAIYAPGGDTSLVRWLGPCDADDPGLLADALLRVGAGARATRGLVVDTGSVVLDHVSVARIASGSVSVGIDVAGNDVAAYGLAVEGASADGIRWHGERGHAVGIEVHLPTDATQGGFGNAGHSGLAVGDFVRHHSSTGVAVYASFAEAVVVRTAIRASASPNATIVASSARYLGGRGSILAVVNGVGGTVGPMRDTVARLPYLGNNISWI
mmetsp:Transcript_8783/g.26408  ORF Transcript_8783/g.26408 Transcript_8783/m.26408 type:complete len:289 (+) Transcript_8783:986-1852(+)